MQSKPPRLLMLIDDTIENPYRTELHYIVDTTASSSDLVAMLFKEKYDVVVLDERVIGSQLTLLANTIKHRFPLTSVIALTNLSDSPQTIRFEPYADEVISADYVTSDLPLVLDRLLTRQMTVKSLSQRNEQLRQIIDFTHDLHRLPNDEQFIQNVLTLLCDYANLYGASVALNEGDTLKLYSLRAENTPQRLYESPLLPSEYNPFVRATYRDMIQVYEDVNIDSYYVASPSLLDARASVFIPLRTDDGLSGAIGLFRTGETRFENDEIQRLELFASHIAVALSGLIGFASQKVYAQNNEMLVRAWDVLTAIKGENELIGVLRDLAQESYGAKRTLMWIYGENSVSDVTDQQVHIFTDLEAQTVFGDLLIARALNDVINRVNVNLKPILLWKRQSQGKPLERLFEALDGEYLVFLPISDPTRMLGLMVLSYDEVNGSFSTILERLETLGYITGRVFERMAFINVGVEQPYSLRGALDEISPPFVIGRSNGTIAYLNPAAKQMLNTDEGESPFYKGSDVLKRIADQTDDAFQTLFQLTNAVARLHTIDNQHGIIVPMQISGELKRAQLFPFPDPDLKRPGWVLILQHTSIPSALNSPMVNDQLKGILDNLAHPHMRLREIVFGLSNNTESSKKTNALMLRSLEYEVEKVGLLWNNLINVAQPPTESNTSPEDVDLNELVQFVLDSRFLRPLFQRCRVNYLNFPLRVRIDVTQVTQALTNILAYMMENSPGDTEAVIEFKRKESHVILRFINPQTRHTNAILQQLLTNPSAESVKDDVSMTDFGLFVARQIIIAQGGDINAQVMPQSALMIDVRLPISATDVVMALPEAKDETIPQLYRGELFPAPSTPRRTTRDIAFFRGDSTLSKQVIHLLQLQNYHLHFFNAYEVNQTADTRFDLIVIDVHQHGNDALGLYRSIWAVNKAPVVMISDSALTDALVEALNLGVQDYLTSPITNDELSARISIILNRVTLGDRTREPMRTGDLVIDFAHRQVFVRGQPIALTRLEYELLQVLAINAGQTLTHHQLLTQVWGPEYRSETQYLWVNIRRLRQKIEVDPGNPFYVRTQPRNGYFFYQEED